MDTPPDFDETTLLQRLALLALLELDGRVETPATALDVRDCCRDHVEEIANDVLGSPTEVDLSRALKELSATALLEETPREPSATGKGRPVYEVTVDEEELLTALATDDRLAAAVERVRDARA